MPSPSVVTPAFRNLTWPIHTPRLTIRPATLEDGAAMWAYRNLADVGAWLGWHPANRHDWDVTNAEKYANFLVVEHEGELIGDLMLRMGDGYGQREVQEQANGLQAELGWVFAPEAGGQGFATESVEALIAVCFAELGLRRLEAGAFADNEPSWRLMERVGMRREAYSVKESLHRDLGWIDSVTYALLAEEWREQRAARAEALPYSR